METFEAKILLKNLLNRIETLEDGSKQLTGVLTGDELEALTIALAMFGGEIPAVSQSQTKPAPFTNDSEMSPIPEFVQKKNEGGAKTSVVTSQQVDKPEPRIDLDLSALTSPTPPTDVRLCLDFGTAMSKATLVKDENDGESEDIHVLELGVPGDQEEISEWMLISSVYIDNDGILWFGKMAVDRSMLEGADGSRQRLDNIKRRLSEDGWDEKVGSKFNPTDIEIKHGDMVLAYLMFMTWAVNSCLEKLRYPWNLPRRFAMPCLPGEKGRETVHRLKNLVGEAQVLADTFYSTLESGIPLAQFMTAVHKLREGQRTYPYVAENITEPLGVAGSVMSWREKVNMLAMVVDVGAGTSDLSLFRIHFDPETEKNTSSEIEGSSRGLTEAGNYLDRALIELIVKKSGITSEESIWINVRSELELKIRDYKESLFKERTLFVNLINGAEVDIELDEFLSLEPVQKFGASLREAVVDILESIDDSWVNWILADPRRNLVLVLTGGGAELPMVQALAKNDIRVNGTDLPVALARSFPEWLRELDANLEADYPRVAVSLGGARKRLIKHGMPASITAGDLITKPTLGGYYQKGN